MMVTTDMAARRRYAGRTPVGGTMTRRTTRILWGLIGACLIGGIILSMAFLFGPPELASSKELRQLDVLFDVMAVLFWMLIFGIYWTNRK